MSLLKKNNQNICALIITYNCGRIISKTIGSIKNQVDKVIIIDNNSQYSTKKYLYQIKEKNHEIKIIFNQENYGIAKALNQGVNYALKNNFKWILTLDHDSIASSDMVKRLLDGYFLIKKKFPKIKIGILAPIIYDYNIKNFLFPVNWKGDFCQTRMVISSGSLINSSVFKDKIFFNEDFFIYYVDNEFCLKVNQKGYKIFLIKKAKLLHREGEKKVKRFIYRKIIFNNYSSVAYYYIFRNGIYYIKNYCPPEKFLIIKRIFKDFIKIFFYDQNRIKSLKLVIRGILDGYKGRLGKINFQE